MGYLVVAGVLALVLSCVGIKNESTTLMIAGQCLGAIVLILICLGSANS